MRILLVEDNPGDVRILRETLLDTELRLADVSFAASFAEARERLAREAFDVVLLDLSLPDSAGLDTVRQTLPHAGDAPILVLTGLDDESVAVQAVQAGAQDYLVKGRIDPQVLTRSIRYARERKRLDRDRERALAREQEARSSAEAAVRARDDVLGIVSHDLGNSLTAIGLHASLLARANSQPEEVVRRAGTIRQLVEQMHRLRQDLVDVVSIEAGRLALVLHEQPLGPIVVDSIDTIESLAQEKQLEIRKDLPAFTPWVNADRERLLQVLSNLLGNAVKFTPTGGRIIVRVDCTLEEVVISVEDTGPGITREDADRVFDAFWRKERGERGGAGLGLAIARGIIARHGGRIWVESETGRGSAFRFALPLVGAPGGPAPETD